MATVTNSMTNEATRPKNRDGKNTDKIIGKMATPSSPMDMQDRMRAMRTGTMKITTRKVDNTTRATSSVQAEAATLLRMDRECKGHHRLEMEIIEDSHLSPEDKTRVTASLRSVPDTPTKALLVMSSSKTAMDIDQTFEIRQLNDPLRHRPTVGRVKHHLRLKSRKRVRWRSGKPKNGRGCTRLQASLKSSLKTMHSQPSRGIRRMGTVLVGVRPRAHVAVKSIVAHRPLVVATSLGKEVREATINSKCRLPLLVMGSRIQTVPRSLMRPFTSSLCRIMHHSTRKGTATTATIDQRSSSRRRIGALPNQKGIRASLHRCRTTLNLEATMNPSRNPGLGRNRNRIRPASKTADHRG